MKIFFFNHYHNGDIVATKEFVREFMNKVPAQYSYIHRKHPKVISDLIPKTDFSDIILSNVTKETKFLYDSGNNALLINTWVGAYIKDIASNEKPRGIDPPVITTEGLNWKTYHLIWQYIFKVCSDTFQMPLTLDGTPKDYAIRINYDKYIKELAVPEYEEMILFSNGLVESGQNNINDDMSSHIEFVARNLPKKLFFCTRKFQTNLNNIAFTEDVFKGAENDLNEISFLSTVCTKIIGRNSGPFLFTNTEENLNNPEKKFLAFSRNYQDCFPADLDFPCDFRFVEDVSQEAMREAIVKISSE